jgi:hypothetical protein
MEFRKHVISPEVLFAFGHPIANELLLSLHPYGLRRFQAIGEGEESNVHRLRRRPVALGAPFC